MTDGSGSARDDGSGKGTVHALGWGKDGRHEGVDLIFPDGPIITLTMKQARDVHHRLGLLLAITSAEKGAAKSATGDTELDALLAAAKARYEAMSPEEQAEHDQAN